MKIGKLRRRLETLWALIPHTECKGLCQHACGPIGMSLAEQRVIEEETGEPLRGWSPQGTSCPYLNGEGRCDIYAVRPLICRAYGAMEGLRCPHGCRPERLLPDAIYQTVRDISLTLIGDGRISLLAPASWIATYRAREAERKREKREAGVRLPAGDEPDRDRH